MTAETIARVISALLGKELKPCKHCGGFPKLLKKKKKFFCECGGDCWTSTSKHSSAEGAFKEWNAMQKEEGEPDARN